MDHHHYERAFETWLRRRRAPYVAIDQVRRSADRQGPIKSFDFLVHAGRKHYIVDVKGKRFPQSSSGRETWWENWVHFDDLEGLFAWESHFGPDYEALLVYCYWLQIPAAGTDSAFPSSEKRCLSPLCGAVEGKSGTVPENRGQSRFSFDGRDYLLVAVPARAFAERCRRRSARWKAVHVPEKDFTRLIKPAEFYIPGTAEPQP